MSKKILIAMVFCLGVSVVSGTGAEEPEALLETPLALAFGAPPTIGDPMLSPDGSRLLFIQQNPAGVSMLLSLEFESGEIATLLQGSDDGYDIYWCKFADETRVICDLRVNRFERDPQHQQLVAVNIDGSDLKTIRPIGARRDEGDGALRALSRPSYCRGGFDHLRGGPTMHRLPDTPDQVLFFCEGLAFHVNTTTGNVGHASDAGDIGDRYQTTPIWEYNAGFGVHFLVGIKEADPGTYGRRQRLYSNGRGFGEIYRGTKDADRWFVRDSLGADWAPLLEINVLDFEAPFRPVGHGTDLDRVLNIDWDPVNETWGIFSMALKGDRESELVFSHDAVDIELVDTMGRDDRVVSAAFLVGRSRRAIVDRRVREVYEHVSGILPELEIEIVDESWDQNVYLARVRPPSGTSEFLRVDMSANSIDLLGPEHEHLTGYPLAETRLVSIESSRGGNVAAHLTLPHTVAWPDPAVPVPAVIIPRGMPTHEGVADPHYLIQFLAARGYAVLRVQNRVDAEYGTGWVTERAIVGWRQSAADLIDAAAFLVDQGVSEAGGLCLAGKDYGAYTALMTAIEYPESFQCVISIAGVTDPRATPDAEMLAVAAGKNLLDDASPVRRADEVDVPLLMFHGSSDIDIDPDDHSLTLKRVLDGEDKDVVLIQYRQANHDISRGPDRIDMLTRLRGFLAEHIGPELIEDEAASTAWRQ